MAGHHAIRGESAGPGNKAIATTLLEWLAVRGRSAARDRAERSLGLGPSGLADASAWIGDDAIAAMFMAAEVDEPLARSIGHRLVTPDATGLRLYGLGLATPEKAYRRLQSLLPRAESDGEWVIETIEDRSARIRFESDREIGGSGDPRGRIEPSLCALRKGLLEAIPGLYGLLPADVEETTCRASGAEACEYEVRWHVTSRTKTWLGAMIGLALATGLAAGIGWLAHEPSVGAISLAAMILASLAITVLGPVVGRMLDLRDQLEAVAGARRGHLALFDQVDDALAEKLDALARADASLEGEERPNPVRRQTRGGDGEGDFSAERREEIVETAQRIHSAAGDLECYFDAQPATGRTGAPLTAERGLAREIRDWSAKIAESGAGEGEERRVPIDLVQLVRRSIATVRPSVPAETLLKVESDSDLPKVECEPVQIEHVVEQLLRNAVEASAELTAAPEVLVTIRRVSRGVEVAVSDRGVGIDSAEVDEVFDPFFGDGPAGATGEMGLAVCLRVVERHEGELRIEAEARKGTRVTVFLPRKGVND